MLSYLEAAGLLERVSTLTELLRIAGACSKLAATQWLRQHGAEWPAELCWVGTQWQNELLTWARAEGCTSPTQ
jgi:hypothetical protein